MDSGILTQSIQSQQISSRREVAAPVEEVEPTFISRVRLARAKRIKKVRTFLAEMCNSLMKPRSPTKRVQRVVERVDSVVETFHERLNSVMERK